MSMDAFFQECNQWKLLGVAAWHLALFLFGSSIWHLAAAYRSSHFKEIFSLSGWVFKLLFYASSLLVLYTQRKVLTTRDVPPLYVARLGWSAKSWPSLLITRCIIRRRTLWDVVDVLLFYTACCISSCVGLYFLRPAGAAAAGSQQQLVYSSTRGLMYAIGYLIRGKNVLSFPILQQHRYFRMKQRMRALAKSSLLLPTVALLPASLVAAMLQASGRSQQQLPLWGGWAALLGLWRGGLLCVYSWQAGAHLLEIVFTERVAMAADDDPQPTAPLLAALQSSDPVVQEWCLMDLAAVAEGVAGGRQRRAAIFDDESGANGWIPIARYCLKELQDFVAVVAAALPSMQTAATAGTGVKWNALQLTAAGGKSASRAQDTASWHLQASYYRLCWCMRILSGLAAAALKNDKFGVLHFSSPGLGDVLATQLAVVMVLQAFLKHSSSIPSRPASAAARLLQQHTSSTGSSSEGALHVDVATCALLDTAKTCTYRITNTYQGVLASLVANTKPVVGTVAESQALLVNFLNHQE